MDEFGKLFTTLLECISILLWLHISFRKRIKQSRGKLYFVIIYVAYYYILNQFKIGIIFDIIPIVLVFVWVKLQFHESYITSIVKYIMCLLGVGLIQAITFAVIGYLDEEIIKFEIGQIYITASIISVIISMVIYFILKNKGFQILKLDEYSVAVLVFIAGIVLFIKYDYEKQGGIYSYVYMILFFLLMLFVIMMFKGLKVKHNLEQKQQELEARENYENAYEKLLMELRRKQHDYDNQIAALYSLQILEDNQDNLGSIQKEYAEELLTREKYDELIMKCDNPILTGYVYTCCIEAAGLGIRIEPNIICQKNNSKIALHQIIEILGILINNAIEYLKDSNISNKEINVQVFGESSRLRIVVSNVAEYITYNELEKMFQMGYSTKGDDRGIGLYSLKHIVQKNKGKLIVDNISKSNKNWLEIEVVF